MKKLLTIWILMIFAGFVNAQNWQPIKSGYSYNYILGTGDIITHVIKTDSIEVFEGDSVFYLNRIVTDCDTCSNIGDDNFLLKNQPQFLMREMVKKLNGLYVFQNPDRFVLYTLANVNDSWVYDSVNNITAICESIGVQTIFDIEDSVKTFTLSNGKEILISKSFGIIDFPPNYQLVGVEGAENVGDHLPGFYEFYDFAIGDVFQLKYRNIGGGDGHTWERVTKYEILEKEAFEDSIKYQIYKYDAYWEHIGGWDYSDTTFFSQLKTIKYSNSPSAFVNRYPNQLYDFEDFFGSFFDFRMLNKTIFTKENGLWIKYSGALDEDFNDIFPHYDVNDSIPDLLERNIEGPQFIKIKYTEGYGREYRELGFEYLVEEYFTGKVHNGDTTGTIYPNSFFMVGVNDLKLSEFEVYPNPATSKIIVQSKSNQMFNRIEVIDITGRTQFVKNLLENKQIQLDIGELSKGFYIVHLIENGIVVGTAKFQKR